MKSRVDVAIAAKACAAASAGPLVVDMTIRATTSPFDIEFLSRRAAPEKAHARSEFESEQFRQLQRQQLTRSQ